MTKLLISTGSLVRWPESLEAKIGRILDTGVDGVEIIGSVALAAWHPTPELVRRLQAATVTLHAELTPTFGLAQLAETVRNLPFRVVNVTFHPDELQPGDFAALAQFPVPASIEAMDTTRTDWRTPEEVGRVLAPGVGVTVDVAHAIEHGLDPRAFEVSRVAETHLSVPTSACTHDMAYTNAGLVPPMPQSPLWVIEGVVPEGDTAALAHEVKFAREQWA